MTERRHVRLQMGTSLGVFPPTLPLSQQDLLFIPAMASISWNRKITEQFALEGTLAII